MKRVSVVALIVLAAGAAALLIWLHDLRAPQAVAQLSEQATEKRVVIARLERGITVLEEFLASGDPLRSRLADEARRDNPGVPEEDFEAWFSSNLESLRARAENDIKTLPAAIRERKSELAALEAGIERAGGPWAFDR